MKLEIPENFDEILNFSNLKIENNRKSFQKSTGETKKSKHSDGFETSKILAGLDLPNKKPKEKKKLYYEKENEFIIQNLKSATKKYIFGLNSYIWLSQYRTLIQIISEIFFSVLIFIYTFKRNLQIFELLFYLNFLKWLLLFPDFIFTRMKKKLFITDLFYGVVSIISWVIILEFIW